MQIKEGGLLHASAALPPEKQPRYLLRRKLLWSRSRSGKFDEEEYRLPLPCFSVVDPAV